ncbi:MAG TPA: AAA family ATPase [Gaiellaceae bacterium]|nr:AAA family ATPase [Gaiellaceae bacterium]
MTTADEAAPSPVLAAREESRALSDQWRALRRSATFVAVLSAPAAFLYLWKHTSLSFGWAIVATAGATFAFRGLLDLAFRRFIPWPSLFATDDSRMREEDVLNRRRAWFWHSLLRWAVILAFLISVVYLIQLIAGGDVTWWGTASSILKGIGHAIASRQWWTQAFLVLFLFLANFLIFMGPLMLMGISQIRGFEPGDANWGVKLEDVRGQAEAKEEVRRIVNLWQSGEAFERAGGRRERGILFHGAPGTGKTMLAKAIATGFNSPFVSIPGSGFAQTFIGIDALIVRYLARKAKKLASKWGGQCIVFIDEIDAVGMRRASLGGATGPTFSGSTSQRYEDYAFYGPNGALNPTGDLILETKGWRDRLFAEREPPRHSPYPGWWHRLSGIVNQAFPGGMFGGMGQLALNQLLVTMDGIDNPPFWRRFWTNRINTLLDASYVVPRRIGKVSLRLPAPRPTGNQIYFIGATNVPLEHLDPALRRPGRMGRHVWFRTPTKHDREDIFELYLGKVAHDEELDQQTARDELARITNGYSPAMIEQVCSMALTHAHHDGREQFTREDIVEAMTTVESGTAIGVEYVPEETRAVAIHEAGHAATAHVFLKGVESTRISIRMRAGSLGHHQALEKEERFSSWKHEEMGKLAWTLGALAAEHVFYGENATGVGGDLQSATGRAAWMVGVSGMGPDPVELNGRPRSAQKRDEEKEKIQKRFEKIGLQLMNRASGDFQHDAIASVLGDPTKRALAAQIIGQAYLEAYNLVGQNKEAVEKIADTLVARRELYGNELIELLNSVGLKEPEYDLTKEDSWPKL